MNQGNCSLSIRLRLAKLLRVTTARIRCTEVVHSFGTNTYKGTYETFGETRSFCIEISEAPETRQVKDKGYSATG